MSLRDRILRRLNAMKVGDSMQISPRDWRDAFSVHPMFEEHYYGSPEDKLFSGLIGSAWGCWTLEADVVTGTRKVCRHEGNHGAYCTYVDFDRRDRYRQDEKGHWHPIPGISVDG